MSKHNKNKASSEEVKEKLQEDTCEDSLDNDKAEETEGQNETEETEETEKVIDESVLLKKQIEALREENQSLKEENKLNSNKLKTVEDKYTNLFNEYDNYRKRTTKEKEEIFNDSCEKILKEFLPVLDNLERAVSVDGTFDELKTGIEMIIKSFTNALDKMDIEEIPTEGEFDPNFHNAVMHIEDPNLEKNQIAQVFQKGYKRGEKVLRHSMVQVAN